MALPTSDEILESAAEALTAGKSASSLDKSVTNYNIEDYLRLQERIAAQEAASLGSFGLRYSRIVPPGGGGG